MKLKALLPLLLITLFLSCKTETKSTYFDYSNADDQFTGGIKMIPITTPKGTFNVWTKRVEIIPK